MTTQVVKNTTSRIVFIFFPTSGNFRTKSLKMSFIIYYLPKFLFCEEFLHRKKITIPPAVMIHAKDQILFLRKGDQFICFLCRGSEGFFHHHMIPCGNPFFSLFFM